MSPIFVKRASKFLLAVLVVGSTGFAWGFLLPTRRPLTPTDFHQQVKRKNLVPSASLCLGGTQRKSCRSQSQSRTSLLETKNSEQADKSEELSNTINSQQLVGRKRQQRRKPRNRRPRYYWTKPKNMAREIRKFWLDCGLEDASQYPLMIPNESLLHHYGRHDLRAALQSTGGRPYVAELLGGARIMPGRWSDAIKEPQIQALLKIDASLSPDQSPSASSSSEDKWSHASDRKPKGYWNLTRVIAELYEYVDGVRQEHGRPSVWMPRPNEMAASGRDDLRQAIQRFGGTKKICALAGMVPFREWYFFEGQLELLILLKEYIDEYENGEYTSFPNASDVRRNGYEQLYSLIQYYGGRKYLAFRLGMSAGSELPMDDLVGVNWGDFDLVFAISLLSFVRQDHMARRPPLSTPLLVMPRRKRLLAEEPWLHECIQKYGGYENVARRLGLAFFS